MECEGKKADADDGKLEMYSISISAYCKARIEKQRVEKEGLDATKRQAQSGTMGSTERVCEHRGNQRSVFYKAALAAQKRNGNDDCGNEGPPCKTRKLPGTSDGGLGHKAKQTHEAAENK